MVWRGTSFSYEQLEVGLGEWRSRIASAGLSRQAVVALDADFSPAAIAALIALVEAGCIVVPVLRSTRGDLDRIYRTALAGHLLTIQETEEWSLEPLAHRGAHPLYARLRELDHPGLVLFSSGTSGEPKAAVHDMVSLLDKFRTPRPTMRTITFLLFDHIGGINTIFNTLSNGATLITIDDRSPDAVFRVIEQARAEVLPASPTFLRLLLLSAAHERYDLSSLRVINYGTEPMPETTLRRLRTAFPGVRLTQSYGLAEVGILRAKSRADDSVWLKIGGEGVETRVVEGLLEIRSRTAMLGYLNAPSPFTADGWLRTGDAVNVDGDFIQILGRRSEMINVGGEKVHPSVVEEVIETMPNVAAATVYGEPNALMGNIVCARIAVVEPEDERELATRVKRYCRDRLPSYQVPVRVSIAGPEIIGERFKKVRRD